MSRSSVREALSELSKTHIVEVVPQSGSRISLVDLNLVDEARFLRNTLECAVTKEMCENRTEDQLISLKKNIKLQEIYLEYNMTDQLLELDNEFHKMLFDFTNKTEIYELVHNFSIHYDRLRSMTMVAVKNLKIVEDHRMILEYIESRDVDNAIKLMECHLSRYRVESDEIKERYPTYFK
ncbi:MAG: GntR family transcriptional regulator [Clostridiales bacterium]|nr:GntR family transcriptional regulator [Clostridiales bacterium]